MARDVTSLCAESSIQGGASCESPSTRRRLGVRRPFAVEVPETERARHVRRTAVSDQAVDPAPGRTGQRSRRRSRARSASPKAYHGAGAAVILFVHLTRDEAEEKHRTRQDYALATRRPDGNLLVVRHATGWSPHDPERPKPRLYPRRSYHLEVHGPRETLLPRGESTKILTSEARCICSPRTFMTKSVHREIWYTHNNVTERTIAIHDKRGAQRAYDQRPMTDSEFALCKFADPGFGNFDELWRHVELYLRSTGFGTLSQNAEPLIRLAAPRFWPDD